MSKIRLSSLAAVAIVAIGFSGCWDPEDDEQTKQTNGVAVDGYIYNAKVHYMGDSEYVVTNRDGKFTIDTQENKVLVLESNSSTINAKTTSTYSSTLLAPAGYSVITPLTTLLATNNDLSALSSAIGIDEENLTNFIKKDPIALLSDLNSSSPEAITGAKLYAKGVLVEKILDIVMLDSNKSDYTKKQNAAKVLFSTLSDSNKSLSSLTSEDFDGIYEGYKTLVKEAKNPTNKTNISKIASNLVKLNDSNFTIDSVEEFEKSLATVDLNDLLSLSDENLTKKLTSTVLRVSSSINGSDEATLSSIAADKLSSDIDVNNAPEVVLGTKVVIKDINSSAGDSYSFSIDDFSFSDENSANVTYSVELKDTNDFITFDDDSVVKYNLSDKNITLNIDNSRFSTSSPLLTATLTITPKDEKNIVGNSKDIFIIIKDSTLTASSRSISRAVVADADLPTTVTLKADDTTGKLSADDKIVSYSVPADTEILFASSDNTDVATVDYNSTNLTANAVYNGDANISFVTMDKSYNVDIKSFVMNISGINLPPVLTMNSTYKDVVVIPNQTTTITIPYTIDDPDSSDTNFNVNFSPLISGITCSSSNNSDNTLKDGNITCDITDTAPLGKYSFSVDADDTKLNSSSSPVTLNIIQGNVAPTLTLYSDTSLTVDTMSETTIYFKASDLNGIDDFDITATTTDNTIVEIGEIDKVAGTLKLLGQPKVGSATIKIVAEDKGGLTSKEAIVNILTQNKLSTLVNSLYLVPPVDANSKILDTRYSMSGFKASYDIENDAIKIAGDLNSTAIDLSLEAYPDDSLYGGKQTISDTKYYGFVFSNGFEYDGQFSDGRVLVFTEGNTTSATTTPYIWALSTQEEICSAYKDNTTTLNIINTANDSNITCN